MTINYIWNFNIQLLPVSFLVFLYLFQSEFRKNIRFKYTPLYFSVPPFFRAKSLGINFSKELSDDERVSEEYLRDIKTSARFSLSVETILWPLLYGVIVGGILKFPINLLWQSLVIIILIRIYQFSKCIIEFVKEESFSKNAILALISVYIFFIFISFKLIIDGYVWGFSSFNIRTINQAINYIIYDLLLPVAFSYLAPPILFSFMYKGGWGIARPIHYIQNSSEEKKDENTNTKA